MRNLLPTRLPQGAGDRLGRAVARTGVTANVISFIGLCGSLFAAYLVIQDHLIWAGIVFLAGSLLDLVDGAVARATNTASPYGAIFDAVLDRAGEAFILAAAAWYFGERENELGVAFCFLALFGSVTVSYVRARAEIVGMEMREGLFRRQERVAVMSAGLILGFPAVAIGIIAVLANLTALQRSWMLAAYLRGGEAGAG